MPSCRYLSRCRVRKEVKKKLVNYFFTVFISAIDGNYTEWTKWSDCSATCGNGSKTRIRSCTNPPPQYGGDNCVDLGPDTDITECNLKPCSKYILQVHFIVKRLYKFQLSLVKSYSCSAKTAVSSCRGFSSHFAAGDVLPRGTRRSLAGKRL